MLIYFNGMKNLPLILYNNNNKEADERERRGGSVFLDVAASELCRATISAAAFGALEPGVLPPALAASAAPLNLKGVISPDERPFAAEW